MVIPIAMMMLLFGADLARWAMAQSAVTRAAGNLADAAAMVDPDADLSDLVRVELAQAGCEAGTATTTAATPSGVAMVTVDVSCPWDAFSPFLHGPVTARADAVVAP
jgi:hypothetical protein